MDAELGEEMSTNEALRRLLVLNREIKAALTDPDGLPIVDAGSAAASTEITVTRVAAGSPAVLIATPNQARKGGILRNLDSNDIGYYGSLPNVNATTGATLNPGESVPLNLAGSIYVFSATAPVFEWVETS